MARPKRGVPTDREMEILDVLWKRGASTTREVLDALDGSRRKRVAYNSVQTILSIMCTKGWVERDDSDRVHVFTAAQTKDAIETRLIQHLARVAFGGSTMRVVTRALATQPATAEEARVIERLLEVLEDERGGS